MVTGNGVRRGRGWQLSAGAEKAVVGMWFFSRDLEEVREGNERRSWHRGLKKSPGK